MSEVYDIVDMILVMSVNPGYGGQKFITNALKKISELDKIRKENSHNFLIEIDGGVGAKNIKEISDAGCDVFVAGSSVFGADNISAAAVELKNIISK